MRNTRLKGRNTTELNSVESPFRTFRACRNSNELDEIEFPGHLRFGESSPFAYSAAGEFLVGEGVDMWAIDRENLIILGIALGIVAMAGLALLFSSGEQTNVVSSPSLEQVIPIAETTPVESAPELNPTPEPAPEPTVSATLPSSVPIVDGIIHTGEYAHAMEAGGFRVYWTNDAVILRMGLFSPGSGYVAIGLDPDRRMQGANFIIGTVRNGQVEIRDDYGTGSLSHSSDIENGGTNDILAAAGREFNGQTTIEFIIPLDSGDRFDKPLEPGGTYKILVAFHNTSDSFSTRHSQRGSGEIRLDSARP